MRAATGWPLKVADDVASPDAPIDEEVAALHGLEEPNREAHSAGS